MKQEKVLSVKKEWIQTSIVYNISLKDNESFFANGILTHNTPPHAMPHDILVKWVIRKLGKNSKEAIKIAWAIQQKIKKIGIEPHPFVRPAILAGSVKYSLKIKPLL